jgi:hypothetical protein
MFGFRNCAFELWLTTSLAPTAHAIGMKNGWNGKGAEECQSDSHYEQGTFHGCFLLDS